MPYPKEVAKEPVPAAVDRLPPFVYCTILEYLTKQNQLLIFFIQGNTLSNSRHRHQCHPFLILTLPVRDSGGGHIFPGPVRMYLLVIKEDIGSESFQDLALIHTAQEKDLIDPDIPRPQRQDDSLMGRCVPGRHKSRSDRHSLPGEALLQNGDSMQKLGERTFRQGLPGIGLLIIRERLQTALLIDLLGFIREDNRVPIKGYANLTDLSSRINVQALTGADDTCRDAGVDGLLNIRLIGRQEQIRPESIQIRRNTGAAG